MRLAVPDITDAARETAVVEGGARRVQRSWTHSPDRALEDAGFDSQPPARTYVIRLRPTFAPLDGQTLGYRWGGLVENWHQRAFTSFGDGHGVWENGRRRDPAVLRP